MIVLAAGATAAELIGPWTPVIGIILAGTIAGYFQLRNRKSGNQEAKTPTVQELWAKQTADSLRLDDALEKLRTQNNVLDSVRRDRTALSSALTGMRDVFLHYVERVKSGGSTDLTAAEYAALELPVTGDDDIEDTITT